MEGALNNFSLVAPSLGNAALKSAGISADFSKYKTEPSVILCLSLHSERGEDNFTGWTRAAMALTSEVM